VLTRSGAALIRVLPMYLFVVVVTGVPEVYALAWIGERFERDDLAGIALQCLDLAVIDALSTGWLLAAVFSKLAGETVSFGTILSRGLRPWLKLAPYSFFFALIWAVDYAATSHAAGIVGFIAYIVIITALCLYAPVVLQERSGIWRGLRRSLFLVNGNVWRVGVLIVLYVVVDLMGAGLVQVFIPMGLTSDFAWEYYGGLSLSAALNTMIGNAMTVVIAVSYLLLRNDKDGVPVEEIAPVFD
jgi:hypothetical protein